MGSSQDKGCGERKTHTLKFPSDAIVPKHLIHHFVRGYFDGDGCAYIRKGYKTSSRSYINIGICGTEDFLTELKNIAPCISHVRTRKIAKISDLWVSSQTEAFKFRDWMYQDATIWMDRKRQILFSEDLSAPTYVPKPCPHCGGKNTNSKGTFSDGRTRINCKDCKRSYTVRPQENTNNIL